MIKIYAIAENINWISKLDQLFDKADISINWMSDEERLFEHLHTTGQCIVCLPNTSTHDVYSLCSKIAREFPQTNPLLIFESEEELEMQKALRAGARDVVFLNSPVSKITEDLQLAIDNCRQKLFRSNQSQIAKKGRVITVASTKGGVGKTTAAVNLAVTYGKKSVKVALVDLDLQFGDVALFFDVKPKRTIYDWVKQDHSSNDISSYLTLVENNIYILAAPQRPEFAEVISGNDVRRTITELKQLFDVIIIDVSCQLNENTIVALENSDEILVMTYRDLPTLKNSKILLDTLGSLHLGSKTKIVVNRDMRVKGVSTDTVEKVTGKRVFMSIPMMDKAMLLAVNEGRPISLANPRSQIAKKFSQMAETLTNTNQLPTRRRARQLVEVGGHA